MKKKVSYLAYLPVIAMAVGLVGSYVKFQAMAEGTKTKVEEVAKDIKEIKNEKDKEVKELKENNEEKLEKVKKENQEIEKGLTEMRVEQKYLQQSVIDLNNNVKELVQEIKEDRKKKK